MIPLRIEAVDEKTVRLTGIPPLVADCLQRLDEILAQRDSQPARQRLLPKPSSDEVINAEWEQLVTPDLRHLFVTAAETVLRDLTALEPTPQRENLFCLAFPAAHLDAWMSAINQARLILSEQFNVTDLEMERCNLDPRCESDLALIRIHLLGWLLEVLVQFGEQDNDHSAPDES